MTGTNARINSIIDNLVANWVGVLLGGLITLVPAAWGATQSNRILFWAGLFVLVVVPSLVGYVVWRRFSWGSRRASKHAADLRDLLKQAHPGVRPVLAYIARESACNLIARHGEDVSLKEYMRLIQESIGYGRLKEITFIAKTRPSSWGTRKSNEPFHREVWQYFDDQKTLKSERTEIRMRRILLISQKDLNEDDPDAYAYLKKQHLDAHIDLIHLSVDNIPEMLLEEDLAIFLCSDGRAWIISSNYSDDEKKKAAGLYCARVRYEKHDMAQALHHFYETITNVYNQTTQPGVRLFGALVSQSSQYPNAPDREFLLECGIINHR